MADDLFRPIPPDVYVAHLDTESRRFADVLAGVDPAIPVPSCPDWTAADLVWHLTEVQWFWGSIAGGPIVDEAEIETVEADKPPRPERHQDLLDLFHTARQRLAAAVAEGPDDTRVWSWAAEQTLGFTRRRQAHEALIHRVDAELTAGLPVGPLDPALAADGIDEVLTVMWAEMPAWASFSPGGGVIEIETTDTANAWLVELGRMTGTSTFSGKTYDETSIAVLARNEFPGQGGGLRAAGTAGPDPSPSASRSRDPDAQVRGTAGDLDLWVWNRGNTGIDRSGSAPTLDGLATLIAAGVQ